ncbi:MAG TPA: hypothetical protein VLE49_15455 [Anaerolineales bacterium]|nr:hypothetical protein [Anaerolineales bacterium]
MKTAPSRFVEMPHERIGWWSVGLTVLFAVLFISITNDLIRFSGFLTMTLGVIAAIFTLLSLIWKRERSWLIWLMLVPGLFAIVFSLGEILVPH